MDPQSKSSGAARPWYREAMAWLVFGLPAAAVLAGVATLAIALRNVADASTDPVRRTAQVQVSDLRADRLAAERGLQGRVELTTLTGALRIVLSDGSSAEPQLSLRLQHPIDADKDQEISLIAAGAAWLGRVDAVLANDWGMELTAPGESWRLIGTLPAGAETAELHPALQFGQH